MGARQKAGGLALFFVREYFACVFLDFSFQHFVFASYCSFFGLGYDVRCWPSFGFVGWHSIV